MEKKVVVVLVLAAVFALAVPAMGQQQQDSAFSGFSLDDIQGLAGNLDQAVENVQRGGDSGATILDEVKQAVPDFKSQGQADGMSLDDVNAAAENSFQGASDQGGSSWMDWAKDKLQGIGLVDGAGPSAVPGQAPSSAPGATAGGPRGADSPAAGADTGYNY